VAVTRDITARKVRLKEMRIVEHDEDLAMVDTNELRMFFWLLLFEDNELRMLIAYFNSLYACLFIIGVAALFICIYIDLSQAEVC
jgi:hypothetical protein